jgi:predicted molibdopterin-dependent oxidoreductase YjgC
MKETGMITLTIDGKEIQTEEGKTILEAARENGITIPTLCWHKNLLPIGSCRLCIVEIAGYEKPMASCTTAAVNGLNVVTRSEKLFKMRQEYLGFLLIHHPLDCPVCDAGGECSLQDLCFEHKIERVDLAAEKEGAAAMPYATPLIRYKQDRCVLCLRCIHACREVSGRAVLALEETGIKARMVPAHGDNCISCGECLFVCPVGALTEQVSPLKSRKWQTKRQATTCPHCGFGCSITLDVYQDRFITKIISDREKAPNMGSLCVMGRFGYDFADHQARITVPSLKENGNAKACGLAEAAEAVAAGLARLIKSGKRTGFIVSPRATNEEVEMILQIAGSFPMNVVGSTGQYHTGKVLAAFQKAGIPSTYQYGELLTSDLVVVAGADLLANNHVLGDRVREAVKKNGTRVAVIDPLPASLTRIADVWLKPSPGTDAFLFDEMAGRLIADKLHDAEAEKLEGFAEFKSTMEKRGKTGMIDRCGIEKKAFDKLYALFSKAGKVAVIVGSGISADDDSLAALLNLCRLRGVGKNTVVMPTALQSNALGAMSILKNTVDPEENHNDSTIGGHFVYEDHPIHYLNKDSVETGLKQKTFIVACDAMPTYVSDYAHVVVPTGTFAEKEGTSVAEDGFVRSVNRARGNSSQGFEFLKLLLNKLCGGLYHSEKEANAALYKREILFRDTNGREMLFPKTGDIRFLIAEEKPDTLPQKPFTLILRNLFMNHHVSGKAVYSKMVYVNNPPVAGNKLYISREDAAELNISDGDKVVLESDHGSVQERVFIKEGLRKGVLEYMMLRNRQDMLRLSGRYGKRIPVTIKKG